MSQLFEDGATLTTTDGEVLECVSVGYQETDGEKHHFTYGFRLKSEVDAERETARIEAERLALESEGLPQPEASEPVTPAEQNKEETHHVR